MGRLSSGDRVALVSPASTPDPDDVAATTALLESWGLEVRVAPHALERHGLYAGRDEDRLADVNAALRDPAVRAVTTTRGGVGALRLLAGVDLDALRADPKPLVGFSDITALHLLWQHAGVPAVHGAAIGAHADDVRRVLLDGADTVLGPEPGALTAALTTSGRAAGPLAGGNLELLSRSVGVVPVDLRGHLLLLEANRLSGLGVVDRALTQLRLSGTLDGVVGLAVGRFDDFAGHTDRGWTVLDVLADHAELLGVPVLGGLPVGHGRDARSVPLGTPAVLDADAGVLTVRSPYP